MAAPTWSEWRPGVAASLTYAVTSGIRAPMPMPVRNRVTANRVRPSTAALRSMLRESQTRLTAMGRRRP